MIKESSGSSALNAPINVNLDKGGYYAPQSVEAVNPMQVMAWDLIKEIQSLKIVVWILFGVLSFGTIFMGYTNYQIAQQSKVDYDRYRHAANKLQGITERLESIYVVDIGRGSEKLGETRRNSEKLGETRRNSEKLGELD